MKMKFLLSMIFCCSTPSARPAINHRKLSSQRTEETRALMRLSSAVSERTNISMTRIRRSRGGELSGIGSKSISATQWKPSLCAISEDRVVYVVAGYGERNTAVKNKLAGKSVQRAKIRVRDFNDNDFVRRAPAMNAIPSFSPTVFLF